MKLVFLLGNIGTEYRGTRHNIAWDIIGGEELEWAERNKFQAYVAEQGSGADKIIYARPTTYYNQAGQALRAVMDFYKIPTTDILVIHDDLMLPFGVIRTRIGGRDAGNNGLKSITQHIGSDFARIRIGIASEQRALMGDTAFVLGKLSANEIETIEQLRPQIRSIIDDFIDGDFVTTTHRHQSPAA